MISGVFPGHSGLLPETIPWRRDLVSSGEIGSGFGWGRFYFDKDDTLTFYRVDPKKGAKIEVPDELKEITISTYARKPELGHILEFNLKATYEAHDQGLCWDFPLDHRYDNPELQKHAMEIAEMWLLVTTYGISMTIW